jgi:hypothetical protein
MVKCWAKSLGNCSNKQSVEHYVSANLFDNGEVSLRGFTWCPDEFKTIGIGRAGGKVLCKFHNTALKQLDDAAGEVQQTFRAMAAVRKNRADTLDLLGPRQFVTRRYEIDGSLLERWAIKCAIGLFSDTQRKQHWCPEGTSAIEPPATLVRAVFGLERLKQPMGLYFADRVGEALEHFEGCTLIPIVGDKEHGNGMAYHGQTDDCIFGMLFAFFGFAFLIWLSMEPPEPFPPNSAMIAAGLSKLVFSPNPIDVRITQGKGLSQILKFAWNPG